MRTPTALQAWTRLAACAFALLLFPALAASHPASDLEVGDPLEAELRVLELIPNGGAPAHSGTRPLLRGNLPGIDSARTFALGFDGIARRRLGRALHRDLPGPRAAGEAGATPYLLRLDDDATTRFELSLGIEGALFSDRDTTRFTNGSGVHVRGALGMDHWIVQAHWLIGQVDSAQSFADPVIADEDVLATVEQALVAYHSPGGHWGARFGRGRWHWGPGRESSLLLSKTSAPLTALEFHASLARERLFLTAISATLKPGSGVQFAAHRIEWQAQEGLRIGVSEAAVYHADGWRPLYLIGLLPYTTAQRLDAQDEPGAGGALRNNVMVALDVAWRIAAGSRVYGEVLVDDLHAESRTNPDKLGWQIGWDGLGSAFGTRVRWNGEYTRLSRYVYTSFFGAEASSQGRPLGSPLGPDARQLSLFAACDPSADFELSLGARRIEKGENDLGEPYVPGVDPLQPPVWVLSGVVEETRAVEAGIRWWPASGIDLGLRGGYEWRENAGHTEGRNREGARATFEVRLTR